MLALVVREGNRVFLDHGPHRIVVQVVKCGRDKVRLGFEAPEQVRILREEIAGLGEEELGHD